MPSILIRSFAFFIFLAPLFSYAQVIYEEKQKREHIKLFVECNCDKSYIRQEIKYIDHVRDQGLSNVTLFIYDLPNGSGGRTYKLEFSGLSSFEGITKTSTFDSNANMTVDEVRKQLTQVIGKSLLPYVLQSDLQDRITYQIEGDNSKEEAQAIEDPWKNWIFEVYGEGKFDKEASRKRFEYKVGLESDKVTENWRVRADAQLTHLNSKFIRDEEEFTSTRDRYWGSASIVRSVSDHWSTGIFGNLRHDTYTNMDLSMGFSPAIEYNIFPYSEVLKREIVFAYKIGYLYNNYIETTIFGFEDESIWNHSFDVQVRYRQPWGNIFSRIRASSFLEDFSKNRLQMNSNVSVRVIKGFSVRFSGNLEFIHDQVNLPAGDASLEDVLLQQKQIATDFDLGFSVGLSYTFGSAFNNIINTRL
jgi:hypothetical protein